MVTMALPSFNVAEPNHCVPFTNLTLPVGLAGAVEVTVAVSVTVSPEVEGFGVDVSMVVEG